MKRPQILFLCNTPGSIVTATAQGIAEACQEQGIFFLWRDVAHFDAAQIKTRPLGVIVSGLRQDIAKVIRDVGGRFPVVSTVSVSLDMPVPTVVADSGMIGELVADHLVEEGFDNFIYIGMRGNPGSVMRREALRARLKKRLGKFQIRSFNAPVAHFFWGNDSQHAERFRRILAASRTPVALVAFTDLIAASCMECVEGLGLHVPREVALVGADDSPIFAKANWPLTSVRVDYKGLGRTAVEMLLQRRNDKGDPWERRFIPGELVVRESSQMRMARNEKIARALRYIHAHLAEKITLETLVKHSGLSRTRFSVMFHQVVDTSPMQYLVRHRLQKARELLEENSLTVAEIAFSVGFQDHSHFTHVFRRHYGVTPRDYREQRAHPEGGSRSA